MLQNVLVLQREAKQLRAALKRTNAPIVDIDLSGVSYDTPNTKEHMLIFLERFTKDKVNFWEKYRLKYKNAKIDSLVIHNQHLKGDKPYKGGVNNFVLLGNLEYLISIEIHENETTYKQILDACQKGRINSNLKQLKLYVRKEV